jgi:prolyl oligopeptidase
VPDPYRWLEDSDSAATKAWIAAQQACYGSYRDAAGGAELQRRVRASQEASYNYARVGLPTTTATGT